MLVKVVPDVDGHAFAYNDNFRKVNFFRIIYNACGQKHFWKAEYWSDYIWDILSQ